MSESNSMWMGKTLCKIPKNFLCLANIYMKIHPKTIWTTAAEGKVKNCFIDIYILMKFKISTISQVYARKRMWNKYL